jgi:hypothetical protein
MYNSVTKAKEARRTLLSASAGYITDFVLSALAALPIMS